MAGAGRTVIRAFLTIGTRPEAIKMAPVVHECLARAGEIDATVCFTGQHRELLDQVAGHFGLRPDVDLALMQPGQSPAEVTARCLAALDEELARRRPDYVVAQGDTSTVLAASLAAFYRRIPFVHVEAGLRTGNLQAPWPEELNRRVASLAASLHCAPTSRAARRLLEEGCPRWSVHVTGNTVIDALCWTLAQQRGMEPAWAARYAQLSPRVVLVTGHRRESFGAGLEQICLAILRLAERFADVSFVYPVHLNPQVRETVQQQLGGRTNVLLCPPAAYPEFVWLMNRSSLILTDSGGVQEEAPSLGKPVLVMRQTTERPEAVEAGAAELVGTDAERIVARASALLSDPREYAAHQVAVNPYGDGQAARRIVDLMVAEAWRPPAA